MGERAELAVVSAIEYVYLVLLWMAFVSKTDKVELWVGLAVALIATVADAVVKAEGMGHFRPQLRLLLLVFLVPWYVVKGTWTALRLLPRALRSRRLGKFKAERFDSGEQDAPSATRRTLAIMLLTIPPNSVIVGIDGHNGKMLIHEMEPEPPSLLSRELGVEE